MRTIITLAPTPVSAPSALSENPDPLLTNTSGSRPMSRAISRTWSKVLPGPSDPELRKLGLDNNCTYSFKDVSFGVKVCGSCIWRVVGVKEMDNVFWTVGECKGRGVYVFEV